MLDSDDIKNLDNEQLVELLSVLEGMDSILEEQEKILNEGERNNED